MAGGPRRGGRRRKKVCYFTANGITHIDYKDTELLKRFISNVHVIWLYCHMLKKNNNI